MPFNIDEDVEIGPTPGHTGNDVLVVVKKANLGVLAGVGDLFYCEGDLFSPSLWLKNSERQHLQVQSRYTILEMADFIIPGHGPTFKVPKGYKSQRILDEHEEHISSPQMTTSTSELDEKLY
ncbi:metallo-beta-lactamase domain-containing protein 1 isoform X2 [Biomphalaria glabrata]|nr:metallo-beta-lactamase domain-containing protein 1 isoform X2 [Biomphalaria glabrata]